MSAHATWTKRTYTIILLYAAFVDYVICQQATTSGSSSTDSNQKWIIAIALLATMLGVLLVAIAGIILWVCCCKGNSNFGGQGSGPVYPSYQQPPPRIQAQDANIYRMKPTGLWGAPAAVDASLSNPYSYNNGGSPYGGGGYSPYGMRGQRNYY